MIKKDLVRMVSAITDFRQEDVQTVLDALFEVIKQSVIDGHDVNIRNFARFGIKQLNSRPGRNFHTGEVVDVPPRKKVSVKISDNWNSELN